MFSLQKLLVLAAIIVVVWYGFKAAGRLQALRQNKAERDEARRGRRAVPAEDLVLCGTCRSYVTPAGDGCSRADCPYAA